MEFVQEDKHIEDVFPNLDLKGEAEEYLRLAVVRRVALDRKRNVLLIYISRDRKSVV